MHNDVYDFEQKKMMYTTNNIHVNKYEQQCLHEYDSKFRL